MEPAAAPRSTSWNVIRDVRIAIASTFSATKHYLVRDWVFVPIGIFAILVACYGVNALLTRVAVVFPASVACLALLFGGLLLSEAVLGTHTTMRIVRVIAVPADWSLRWIGLFFTPAFITVPLSPSISVVEVFKIIAVFVIGFVVMMLLTAYMTRGLQLIVGSNKRSETQRAEELHRHDEDNIPLHHPSTHAGDPATPQDATAQASSDSLISSPPLTYHHAHNTIAISESALPAPLPQYPLQSPPLPKRCTLWAAKLTTHLNVVIFSAMLLVSFPIYYASSYAMPLHLCITTLCYTLALATPHPWKQYFHPVLTSSLLTVLIIWPLSLLHHESLSTALHSYKTGTNYLVLWSSSASTTYKPPGAGDVFSTLLDASIVSLALPMFQYRRELRRHFLAIIVPNVLIATASVSCYPALCHRVVGIEIRRSLAFASRSITLALATPATHNLGGDMPTVAALAIGSGILGVLVGERLLKWMRIPDDDYVTRGITLGVNSGAIGTALLLRTDPRAAALSSLSMTLFGTVTVLLTSIPPVAEAIRGMAGL